MVRKFTLLLAIFLVYAGLTCAQTTSITMDPYGVSPALVKNSTAVDTGTIFKYGYSGLLNVGLGTRTYVKVSSIGYKLVAPKMGTVSVPYGSGGAAAIFGPSLKLDDSTYIFTFTPDVLGTFNIKVTDGSYTASLTFNSSTYLGVDNKANNGVNCNSCHPSIYSEWQTTGHSSMLKRGLDGSLSNHYGPSCLSCHTTGYDKNPTAVNNGFDDFTFVFPATLAPGTYDATVAAYPDAMLRANIQCESCHGPGAAHLGTVSNSRMEASWDEAVCNQCHDDASHHIKGEQFAVSKHGIQTVNEAGRADCVPCHTGKGFAQVMDGTPTTDPYFDLTNSKINCQACHDPHDNGNIYQLRTVTANATDGTTPITTGGLGRVCMNCHHARVIANDAYVALTSYVRFGPHHSPTTEVYYGTNFYTFGKTFPQSKHNQIISDACVTCHMAATDNGTNGRPKLMGNHTFSMTSPDGESNMTACAQCHGYSLGGSFADVKFYINGSGNIQGDFDGNGIVEGFQTEVQGYVNKIFALLPAGKTPGSALLSTVPTSAWTTTQKQVLFDLYQLMEDKSYGLHNPKFTIYLLNECYRQLGGTPTEIQESNEVPTQYTLFQNYPNPFNPTTNIKFNLPKEAKVKLTIYDAIGKEITTLVDGQMSAGSHVVTFNATNLASGVYFYRIEAGSFRMTNKMLLMK